MTQDEFRQFRKQLLRFVAKTHQITAVIVVLSFAGYGAAAWVWWRGESIGALVIATLSYLLFRAFRAISVSLARVQLGDDESMAEVWPLIDREIEAHSPQVLLETVQQFERDEASANPPAA